ncbi:conserved protein [Tepidicaulis marinus]|uniref:Conserved protein n=1 Tax=Tepidicaulis marinus TaxID=1333998 RepID=A0A081BD94_9HYPH|nr:hypothetical protein [Tepidicaulis marinus]GAK46012.1 conserved protein [Tepidicaulis marinus]
MSLISAISPQSPVTQAIHKASLKTGTDFDYLLKTAVRESGLETQAKAKTSSAAGLFQFIEQTWLGTVKKHGPELGYGQEAAAIQQDGKGRYFVPDGQAKEAILALRHDAEAASLMAGALTSDISDALEKTLGREPNQGELYIAHFMGTGGAIDFLTALDRNPNGAAAEYFPQAANANKPIFYSKSGELRSLKEVYANLVSKHGDTDVPVPSLPANEAPGRFYAVARDFAPSARSYGAPSGEAGGGYAGLPGSGVPGSGGLQLSPVLIDILASLDVPFAESGGNGARKAANDAYSLRGAVA